MKTLTPGRKGAKALPERRSRDRRERYCLRCGCTENRACAGGCSWVAFTDVCDACLTTEERALHELILDEFSTADTDQLAQRAENKLKAFGKFLNEIVANEPIPFVPITKGGAK